MDDETSTPGESTRSERTNQLHGADSTSVDSNRFLRWSRSFARLRIFEALHYREYRLIWFGQIFASMATWMDQVARGWLLYELTNSTLQLGLIRGVQAMPILLLSPGANIQKRIRLIGTADPVEFRPVELHFLRAGQCYPAIS